MLHTSLCA